MATTREQRAVQGIKVLGWASLAGSTITSWYFLYQLLGGAESLIVSVLLGVGVLIFQTLIDFIGVGTILPTGAKTLAKAVVGEKTRKTVVLAGLVIFALGAGSAFFSGLTSWYGSQIAGSTMAGSFDVKAATAGFEDASGAHSKAIAPYQTRIDSLGKAKIAAVRAHLGSKMAEGFAKGTPWHMGEVAKHKAASAAIALLDKQIAATQKSLGEVEQAAAPALADIAKVVGEDTKMKASAHAAKAEGSFYLLRFFGLGCVVMGLVCQLVIVLLEVAAQTKPKKAQNKREENELAFALGGGDSIGHRIGGNMGNDKGPKHQKGPSLEFRNGTDPF